MIKWNVPPRSTSDSIMMTKPTVRVWNAMTLPEVPWPAVKLICHSITESHLGWFPAAAETRCPEPGTVESTVHKMSLTNSISQVRKVEAPVS